MKRTIKELLQVVLTEGNKDFNDGTYGGLCIYSLHLLATGKIAPSECTKICKYMEVNRPQPGDKHFRLLQKESPFYWKWGTWAPRKRWLKDQINSL